MPDANKRIIQKVKKAKELLMEVLEGNELPMVEKTITNALLELYWTLYNLGECDTLDVYRKILKWGDDSGSSLQHQAGYRLVE